MTISESLELLRRSWLILLIGLVAGIACGVAAIKLQNPVYRASATVLVVQSQGQGAVTLQDIQASQSLTQTYANLAVSVESVSRALSLIDEPRPPLSELQKSVSSNAIEGTQLIRVVVENTSRQKAADWANAVAEAFPAYVRDLQVNGADDRIQLSPVIFAERAVQPTDPVRPNRPLNIAFGALAGLVLATTFSVIWFQRDDRVRGRAELLDLGEPVVGVLPRAENPGGGRSGNGPWAPLLFQSELSTPFAEACRQVQASLAFPLAAADAHKILVTSGSPSEGKSVVAANLAYVLAEAGRRVLLIDGDLRRPSVAGRLRLPSTGGFTSAFLDPERVSSFLIHVDDPGLTVLTAGPFVPNPAQILSSTRVDRMLEILASEVDLIIIDAPPIGGLADALLWFPRVDGVLLVARAKSTRFQDLVESTETVKRSSKLLGIILNDADEPSSRTRYYYTSEQRAQSALPQD